MAYDPEWDDLRLVYPCELRVVKTLRASDPISVSVRVDGGTLHLGTPLCSVTNNVVTPLGTVNRIVMNQRGMSRLYEGAFAVIRIVQSSDAHGKAPSAHAGDTIVAQITRASLDVLKTTGRTIMRRSDWICAKKTRDMLGLPSSSRL